MHRLLTFKLFAIVALGMHGSRNFRQGRGGGGPGLTFLFCYLVSPQLIYRRFSGVILNITILSKVPEGVQLFPGGVQLLPAYSPYTCYL